MEEVGLLGQLGIDWKLLLSQVVNFAILLFVLQRFVYKPLLVVIRKRNEKIQQGLEKAAEADVRLKEVDVIAKKHLQKADQESVQIIKDTEIRAKQLEESMAKKAEEKHQGLLMQAKLSYQRQQEEANQNVLREASELVKRIFMKTVELDPKHIDEMLIKKATDIIKHEI